MQLNWDLNCIFAKWNELDVKSATFDIAEFWELDFESIKGKLGKKSKNEKYSFAYR